MASPRRPRSGGQSEEWLAALARRGSERVHQWVLTRTLDTWARTGRVRSTVAALQILRRADRATQYRVSAVNRAHLLAISELYERAAFDEAVEAAETLADDLVALDRATCDVALRARAERARCLARLDRGDEAVESLVDVLREAATTSRSDARWQLSCRMALAVMRRDVGDLEASTDELRRLVVEVVDEFGEDSGWLIATVTELATNVAISGDPATAVEMLSSLLPRTTTRHGPLSRNALTLRSRIARWTIGSEDTVRGERLCALAIVDFTRAGMSTCAEACELRYLLADVHFERGEVDYAIAQLVSLLEDLDESSWSTSSFADLVRSDLAEWREVQHGGSR